MIIYINSGLHAAGSAENVSGPHWNGYCHYSNFHIFNAISLTCIIYKTIQCYTSLSSFSQF